MWTDRRGRQFSVTPEVFRRREIKRETAKRAGRIGWDTVSAQRAASKAAVAKGRRVYPGPSMDRVNTIQMWGEFRGLLFDYAMSAIVLDGRDPLLVEAVVTSRVRTPDGYEPPRVSPVCLMDWVGGKVRKRGEKTVSALFANLSDGVDGLEIGSPSFEDPAEEVVGGKMLEGELPEPQGRPNSEAKPGYWMDLTSVIHLIAPTKARPDCGTDKGDEVKGRPLTETLDDGDSGPEPKGLRTFRYWQSSHGRIMVPVYLFGPGGDPHDVFLDASPVGAAVFSPAPGLPFGDERVFYVLHVDRGKGVASLVRFDIPTGGADIAAESADKPVKAGPAVSVGPHDVAQFVGGRGLGYSDINVAKRLARHLRANDAK